ncbi:class I adenylate-forming enzyme family protein [Euzebya tangerina]|uniref:class I adenylate-forming enzyme family protein n=1 Tax=Euzebya tangerina TaxID=591198 RepID=UPI000E3166BE|nr:AMP-binding protein [Euzebya tangerina]
MPPILEPASYLGTTVQVFADRPASHDVLLRRAAAAWPDHPAVEAPSATLSYAELDALVDRAAAALHEVAEPGDRIAVALSHDVPLFTVPFLASRAGVTVLLLNASLTPDRWAEQLDTAEPTVVLTDAAHQASVAAAVRESHRVVPASQIWQANQAPAAPRPTGRPTGGPDQTLALIATSGTTGVPKMSRVTTAGLIHAALAYIDLLGLDSTDRAYVCLPLYYIGALSAQTTTMALVGGTCVIPDDTAPATAASRMEAARATYLDAVPSWLGLMVREGTATVPTLRTVIYGGAPMPAEVAQALARRFGTVALWDVWGLSETHGPATALRYELDAPPLPGTVGRPLAGVEVRADSEDGGPGELLVRGQNVTPGYADDEALTRKVIDRGWLRTGDIGTIGPDGTVRLLDRAKDVIMRGGANVFSVEVEQVLGQHPDVVEAAVYGVPDGFGQEAVTATVVLREGATIDVMALRALVDSGIGRHAVPRRITTADSLPRNHTGKIDKTTLRAQGGSPTGRRSTTRE